MSKKFLDKFVPERIELIDTSRITLRSIRKEDVPQCLDIRKAVYGAPFTEEEWRWKYGPGSPYFFDVLVSEYRGKVVGIQALLKFSFQIDSEVKPALNLLDLMIHPQWQKKGIFSSMIDKIERELSSQFSFMYTFPNDRSYHGFIRKFQWKHLFSPCLLARPALLYPGAKFNRQQIAENRVGILKDEKYIKWRYSRPGRIYRFFPEGGVLAIQKKLGIKAGFVAEFPSSSSPTLLKEMENALSPFPIVFLTNPGSESTTFLKRKGFMKQINLFRRIHLVVKMYPSFEHLHSTLANWDLSFGDFDVI